MVRRPGIGLNAPQQEAGRTKGEGRGEVDGRSSKRGLDRAVYQREQKKDRRVTRKFGLWLERAPCPNGAARPPVPALRVPFLCLPVCVCVLRRSPALPRTPPRSGRGAAADAKSPAEKASAPRPSKRLGASPGATGPFTSLNVPVADSGEPGSDPGSAFRAEYTPIVSLYRLLAHRSRANPSFLSRCYR